METLHLYPIMYLNLVAAFANMDPSMEEAARNLGSSGWRLFRRITFPLLMPGFFAGAAVVYIWAFTDLGTPLMFGFRRVVAVQIFDRIKEIDSNPQGYALVVVVLLTTMLLFVISKRFLQGTSYEMLSKGGRGATERPASPMGTVGIYALFLGIIAAAVIPHLGIVLTSFSERWFMTVVPEGWTLDHYRSALSHPTTLPSIRNSILYSSCSTVLDIGLGIWIAYMLTRGKVPGANVLDAIVMLPLALPGIVLAFGYVGSFGGTWIDPRTDPTFLLIISYAVRRLPYMVRAAVAGLQQVSESYEEASLNLGASPMRTMRRITVPLIGANLVAGAILAFSFAMLEVSDSLILASKEQHYPITKTIYQLFNRLVDGPVLASALGVWAMVFLALSLIGASVILGKRMGALFRT
jgi:iron(III) transport system permease protein